MSCPNICIVYDVAILETSHNIQIEMESIVNLGLEAECVSALSHSPVLAVPRTRT